MSIKTLVEAIETARVNNKNLGTSVEARFNELLQQLEDTKRAFAAEIEERDRDLVRLIEGAA